jgi:hypothetical protein
MRATRLMMVDNVMRALGPRRTQVPQDLGAVSPASSGLGGVQAGMRIISATFINLVPTDTKALRGWAHGCAPLQCIVGLTTEGETSTRRSIRAIARTNDGVGRVIMARRPSITTEGDGYETVVPEGLCDA